MSMSKRSYDALESAAQTGNTLEYCVDEIRNMLSALYPDNMRSVDRSALQEQLNYLKGDVTLFTRAIQALIDADAAGQQEVIEDNPYVD